MMMVDFDESIWERPAAHKVAVGLAGMYSQLIYMLIVGAIFHRKTCLGDKIWGAYANYCCCMGLWTLCYMAGYAVHFYDDPTADFAFLTRGRSALKVCS